MIRMSQFKYLEKDSFFHRLSGTSKLIFVILLSLSTFLNEMLPILILLYLISIGLYFLSKITYSDCYRVQAWSLLITLVLLIIVISNRLNTFSLSWTNETWLYFLESFLKIRVICHLTILFILTTHPGRFAASLNQLGVPYRIAYTLSQPLRGLLNYDDYHQHFNYHIQSKDYFLVGRRPHLLRIRDYFKVILLSLMHQNQESELREVAKDMNHFGALTEVGWFYQHQMTIWDLLFLLFGSAILSFSILFAI